MDEFTSNSLFSSSDESLCDKPPGLDYSGMNSPDVIVTGVAMRCIGVEHEG